MTSPPETVVRPCLRSGLCCKKAPCPFGEWDPVAHQCSYLEVEQEGEGWTTYQCGKYEQIRSLPPEAFADVAPAFGAGCCMPLGNTNRMAILRQITPPTP